MSELEFKGYFKKQYVAFWLWLIFITVISVVPSIYFPKFTLFSPDKIAHAGIYGILVWLFYWSYSLYDETNIPNRRLGMLVFLFATAWGAAMEFVQGTVYIHRSFEWDDMIANTFGALASWQLASFWFGRKKRQQP